MRAVTIISVVLFGLWMVLRGHRRGAVAVLVSWLPGLSLTSALYLAVYFRWPESGSLESKLLAIAAVGVLLWAAGWVLYRVLRKRRTRGPADKPAAGTWPARVNRLAGAVLGLFCCMFCCLALSALAASLVFRVTMSREQEIRSGAEPGPPPKWVDGLRKVSDTLATIGDAGLLKHVPCARQYSHEVRCLVTILNAPPDRLRGVADKRKLWSLIEVRQVREALSNEEYRALLVRIQAGDLMALDSIARSPVTEALLACPEIRELTRSMRPSDLVKDLEEQAAAEDAGQAEGAGLAPSAAREARPSPPVPKKT